MPGKKFLTPEVLEKNSCPITSPIPRHKSVGQPLRGKKRIWHLSEMTSINKMACARSSCGGFQDQSFAFLDWKYINKSRIWKGKVQKNARFLFVDKWKLFVMKLSFEKFNLVFFTAESLACFEPIKAARFLKKLEVHSVLCGQEKFVFKRQFSWMFSTFWLRRERKTTKFARFEIDFMLHHAMCSADVTCVNVSTVQLVLCELLLRINSWVFENKFSRNHFKSSFKLPVGLIYFRPIWGGLSRDRGLI